MPFPFLPLCPNKTTHDPPAYSPSAAAPTYSVSPGPSEQILAATARSRRPRPTGVFVRSNSLITIALRDQEEDAAQPSYGRNNAVGGDISLSCTQGVHSVHIRVEGRLRLASLEGGSADYSFFHVSHDVWKSNGGGGTCPSMFPFEFVLPDVFMDNGHLRPLPPTYDIAHTDSTDIRAQCSYLIKVIVQRKGSKLALWKPPKKLTIPFVYRPRTRPPQPIIPSPFPFLSTVKSSPEEWFQITSTMPTRVKTNIEPIDCHLFIPIVQTFAFTDTIPFYLQLIAPSKSLQAFLSPSIPADTKLKRSKSTASDITTRPIVRVYLLRQVTFILRGQLATRKFSIGEGTLRALPPGASLPSLLRSQPLGDGISTLDYEGEVHPNSNITVGQFGMSRLQVRDFITMYLAPSNQYMSPFYVHQHSHPIRLVTDPSTDNPDCEAHQ
ncbi:hypothetical protein BJV78DRAFT_1131125 [Lactifluus subvellereus]|nr:hypothetical protein BJV78DRAFT_1131125 [Lactifluus subvellereus]